MTVIFPFTLAVLFLLRFICPRTPKGEQTYFWLASLLLAALLIFRDERIGADLGRYNTHFVTISRLSMWEVFVYYTHNSFFYLWMYITGKLSGGNYQVFLVLTAIVCIVPPLYLIKRYSKSSFYSMLVFYCFGFYFFLYSGLKQAMAMGILCFAFKAILDRNLKLFITFTILAAVFHFSALIFMPAYFIATTGKSKMVVLAYTLLGFGVLIFRQQLVQLMAEEYDAAVLAAPLAGVGGNVVFKLMIAAAGYLLCTPNGERASNVKMLYFKFMIVSAFIQLFAVYGNVFERLADYYYFYFVLYLPEIIHSLSQPAETGNLICLEGHNARLAKVAIIFILLSYYVAFYLHIPGLRVYRSWLNFGG